MEVKLQFCITYFFFVLVTYLTRLRLSSLHTQRWNLKPDQGLWRWVELHHKAAQLGQKCANMRSGCKRSDSDLSVGGWSRTDEGKKGSRQLAVSAQIILMSETTWQLTATHFSGLGVCWGDKWKVRRCSSTALTIRLEAALSPTRENTAK